MCQLDELLSSLLSAPVMSEKNTFRTHIGHWSKLVLVDAALQQEIQRPAVDHEPSA